MSLDHICGASREIRELARKYTALGWVVDWTNSSHLRWRGPNGELVVTSGTPSDFNAINRIERDIRRQIKAKLPLAKG
jgi:hypothetical protein